MKQEATEKLLAAIHRVLDGELYLSDTMSTRLLNKMVNGKSEMTVSATDNLSDRELEVFHMIGSVMSEEMWLVMHHHQQADLGQIKRKLAALPGSWESQRDRDATTGKGGP